MSAVRILGRHEMIVLAAVLLLALLVGLVNPAFFSFFNLFSLLKNSTVIGLFAIGFFIVLVIGGLDISFTAIGVVAMYGTVVIAKAWFNEAPIFVLFLVAAGIGGGLGLINGLLVVSLRVPSLIITLATASLFRGFLLYFVGTDTIRSVPKGMVEFSRTNVLTMVTENGARVGLHASVPLFLIIVLLVFFLMRCTSIGRSLYAVGGNAVAARRLGMNEPFLQCFAYVLAGLLSGLAGLLSASIIRLANPQTLVGSELDVIAAVVIGGASIFGGRGSVIGVFLGTLLIVLTNNSLILLGVSAVWQKVAVGTLLILAIGLPLLVQRAQRMTRSLPA